MGDASARVGYREIADELRQEIDSGQLKPGAKVPGENDLMAKYGVEQPTARRALDVLKNEGLVVAKRGSGTFVREFRPIRRVSPDRLKTVVWGAGRSIWSADLGIRPLDQGTEVVTEAAPAIVAHVLELDEGTEVVVRRRRFAVEDKPVQLATSYYPAHLVEGSLITQPNTGEGGSYARLAELGYKPVRFREELRTRMPREHERQTLELAQGTPVIEIVRTAYTAEDLPIEVNLMVLDSASYVLEYKFAAEG
ncbi:GntR family transcriptional regulator [Saccharothrix deserti]|uniref:GntR family transcriptional regulator n=1 Tax=Saccharothrix deserti TaxID=2593674 RepID=UPI00131DFDF7|nr:GntR family transcriptional regulator [Saccharothrix deserti]